MLKYTALPATLSINKDNSVSRIVDEQESFPCRRCLQDGQLGEEMLLVSYDPFTGVSPYSGPGPIFIHAKDCTSYKCDGAVPDQQRRRLLSVRAYDRSHMMVGCKVVEGKYLAEISHSLFADMNVEYLHVHYAGAGCFAVRVDRA